MVVFCVKCSFGGFNTKGTKDFEGSVWKLCKQKANSVGNWLCQHFVTHFVIPTKKESHNTITPTIKKSHLTM
jgi:hypothetical protein